ncbi:hypothetical protein L3X39_03000 [Sabulilitoribacter multivorans]|uniref:Chain length determinant protein n=1 Tax=Flaviramulus multivorans TaxID=1304750 RepID=A0ABS9IG40_9FLAO|nr:hypothetical protein [Flaviramulus multivorans]MCF7559590.1 hypothetical protein [Flaviramulus multivorans]
MSKDLQQPQQSEEVDLGQLFKIIGNMFDRLFKFIGGIFNKLFLAFVWIVFFTKKHLIKFVIAGVIGIAIGFLLEKTSEPVYKSYVTLKQNYDTGESLYNSIIYYNDLVDQKDVMTLVNVLEISEDEASSILNFEVESVISENQKLKNFDTYKKDLDSALAATIEYKDYIKNDKDYNHEYQQITIKSKTRNSFKQLFDKVVENINKNSYFLNQQQKDLNELNRREHALKESLVQSDSLKSTYKRVLEKVLDNKAGSQTSVTIESSDETSKTKEYDLYLSDLELRRELVEIEREKEDKKQIIEIVSSKQDSGSIDDKKDIFGLLISPKLYYAAILMALTFVILLSISFIKVLEKYNSKI